MREHTVSLDLRSALATPHTCPGCGTDELVTVGDRDGVSFRCPCCLESWVPELGVLVPRPRGSS
jgi:hypothetical protein